MLNRLCYLSLSANYFLAKKKKKKSLGSVTPHEWGGERQVFNDCESVNMSPKEATSLYQEDATSKTILSGLILEVTTSPSTPLNHVPDSYWFNSLSTCCCDKSWGFPDQHTDRTEPGCGVSRQRSRAALMFYSPAAPPGGILKCPRVRQDMWSVWCVVGLPSSLHHRRVIVSNSSWSPRWSPKSWGVAKSLCQQKPLVPVTLLFPLAVSQRLQP